MSERVTRRRALGAASPEARRERGDRELLLEVAHDLRSPLSAILMMADAMRRGLAGPVTESQDRQLGIICRAAMSLCASASDVVDYARGDARQSARMSFSVQGALDAVRATVAPMLEGRDVELRFLTAPDACRIGDGQAFTRVMLNLVTNALKNTDHGVVEVRITESVDSADRLECSVRDTGRGMAPAVLRAVFAGGDHCAPEDGLTSAGVGLTICRRLVSAMGSTLTAESTQGAGTRFSFTLEMPRIAAVA